MTADPDDRVLVYRERLAYARADLLDALELWADAEIDGDLRREAHTWELVEANRRMVLHEREMLEAAIHGR